MHNPRFKKIKLKVAFIIPVWNEQEGGDLKMSPFLLSQIKSLTPHLESYELIYLEMGSGYRSLKAKAKQLRDFKKKSSDPKGWVVFSLYGSLHGFLVQLILGGKFKIVNTFGGSDILGSTNTGLIWGFRNRLTKMLSLYAATRANHVIVKSTNLADVLRPKIRVPISVLPNGINLEVFKLLENRDELRSRFGWQPKEFVILFSIRRGNSKLEAVKNYPLAEEVISILKADEKSSVRLEIISNKTHQQMNELFNAADCLLLTSLHEGSPNIVKEAMGCNLPIVSVNCGDIQERLISVENSFVSAAYDANELAQLCLSVREASRRSNGRDVITTQGLDSLSVAESLLRLFSSLSEI